jgi:hypothetical protein
MIAQPVLDGSLLGPTVRQALMPGCPLLSVPCFPNRLPFKHALLLGNLIEIGAVHFYPQPTSIAAVGQPCREESLKGSPDGAVVKSCRLRKLLDGRALLGIEQDI